MRIRLFAFERSLRTATVIRTAPATSRHHVANPQYFTSLSRSPNAATMQHTAVPVEIDEDVEALAAETGCNKTDQARSG